MENDNISHVHSNAYYNLHEILIINPRVFYIYGASSGFFTKHNNNLNPYILPKALCMIMIIITIVSRRSYVF